MLEYVIEQQSSVICLLVIINLNQGTELFVLSNTEQNTDIWKEQNSTKQWLLLHSEKWAKIFTINKVPFWKWKT